MAYSFLSDGFLLAFFRVAFPAVTGPKPVMKEQIAILVGNLEAHEAPALPRDNGLLAFAALDSGFKLHGSPHELCLLFLVGRFVS